LHALALPLAAVLRDRLRCDLGEGRGLRRLDRGRSPLRLSGLGLAFAVIGRVDAVEPQLVVLVPDGARLRERAQPERTQAQLLVYAPMLIGVDPGLVDAARPRASIC
jgi:hypothetical protein